MKKDFNATARKMRPDDPFDLDAEVARAYQRHPKLKGNVFFIDVASGRIVHPNLTKRSEKSVRKVRGFWKRAEEARKAKRSYFVPKAVFGTAVDVVLLYLAPDSDNINALPPGYSLPHKQRMVFDHELGHVVSLLNAPDEEKYRGQRLMKEGIAEAYMLLSQYQRYGYSRKISEDAIIGQHASHFLTADNEQQNYFVCPVLDKIVELKKVFDLAAMSPRQAVNMAIKAAEHYTPSEFALSQLRKELRDPRDPVDLKGLSERTLKTLSAQVFKWGDAALRYSMDVEAASPAHARWFKKKHWPDTEKKLARKKKEMLLI